MFLVRPVIIKLIIWNRKIKIKLLEINFLYDLITTFIHLYLIINSLMNKLSINKYYNKKHILKDSFRNINSNINQIRDLLSQTKTRNL